ncbi:hypothetical protein CLV63_104303 [Murinocardiopsis flavida]|uniref:Uncharacterized protein n=1 Tax=Murinocardiopsis flavida TaxID=645275 RepID=A0A2P8DPD9_9ACTN|nr:hypothetical protein [Murinocardiopsis flavida]PSK99079.1 hypothetical protein CLV63_104303 [Murinocardiopsis flavida]
MIVQPRQGIAGVADRMLTPGATAAERVVGSIAIAAGAVVAVIAGLLNDAPWALWQYALIVVLGIDLIGGTVANVFTNAKRWWHRPDRNALYRFGFVAGHVHPLALALLVPGFGWPAAIGLYLAVVVGAVAVLAAPASVRIPVAFGAAVLAIGLITGLPGIAPELAWFAPVFVVKLLIAHMAPESPVAESPATESPAAESPASESRESESTAPESPTVGAPVADSRTAQSRTTDSPAAEPSVPDPDPEEAR